MSIKLISASAGSGKTYTLTHELAGALDQGVQPEGVLATTFTNKAAGELTERVRLKLLDRGRWDEAQRIFDGYIGTVNAVCGQILKDFSLDMGLPPILDVLPDGEDQAIYKRAIFSVVERFAPGIEPIARRLQWEDWRETVKTIGDSARANGIAPADLRASALASWKSFKQLMPSPSRTQLRELDLLLLSAVSNAISNLRRAAGLTKVAQEALDFLEDCRKKLSGKGRLSWSEWVKLSKLDPGKTSASVVSPVWVQAQKHLENPKFHSDLKFMIFKCFACAQEAMKSYAEFKATQGLIDFVDQESLCLEVLKKPHVRELLKTRLELALVDEFQDTSPIELAVFLEMASIARDSIWVGDQKQAIYGFRGADPSLMDSVISTIIRKQGLTILRDSYRSRPALIRFTNEFFSAAFEPLGIPEDRVRLNPKREDCEEQSTALHLWYLASKEKDKKGERKALKLGEEAKALAAGVADMLRRHDEFPIYDKKLDECRPMRGEDLAILCRTNDRCAMVAEELERLGVKASVPRRGLLSQPECVLALATLRYLTSREDTLAAAEIVHFTANETGPGTWFSSWLHGIASTAASTKNKPWRSHGLIQKLDSVRPKLLDLTPVEAFQLGLDTVRLEHTIISWGEAGQRLANIDRMRALAREYEEHCLVQRRAATPAGLVTYFCNELKDGANDTQAEGKDYRAVRVLTYHKAKGLEWPIVALFDLHTGEQSNPFGVRVESKDRAIKSGETLNNSALEEDESILNPLEGRWIRFWPWPYGRQRTGTGLEAGIESSVEYQMVKTSERKELVRLLYVGMTRARDYLILAVASKRRSGSSTAWLDIPEVNNECGTIIKLAVQNGVKEGIIDVCGTEFPVVVSNFEPVDSQVEKKRETVYIAPLPNETREFPPARFIPSSQNYALDKEIQPEPIRIGTHLKIVGNPDMQVLGEAIHTFMATDHVREPREKRLVSAQAILKRWQMECLAPQSMIEASDRLWSYIRSTYGDTWSSKREWPVHLQINDQKAEGWIDLLLETPEGFVIIDHKSFPGAEANCLKRSVKYAPQVALYKKAVELATGRAVLDTLIHLPVSGLLVRLKGL